MSKEKFAGGFVVFVFIMFLIMYTLDRVGERKIYLPNYLPNRDLYIKNNSKTKTTSSSVSMVTVKTTSAPIMTSNKRQVSPQNDLHQYPYLILEKDVCKTKNSTDVFLVIAVCITPQNFEHRHVIRETWASIGKTNPQTRLVFILGNPRDEKVQAKLENESRTYHDIIQEDFVDSYRNLSIKSVAILKWVSNYCKTAKYVLKVDDDMYINVENLVKVLEQRAVKNSVLGFLIRGARPVQDKNSKWYTPRNAFNGDVYPDYCSGTAYVLSSDIVPKLFKVSQEIPLFWLEDIFITGICRTRIKANIVNDWGFTYGKPHPDGCTFRKRIGGHRYTLEEMRKIWKEVNDAILKCQ
ncbi:hypothetical protein FSP39_017750 [Pinctada imbricata]|uniref:Hexosyltransferase n=1 Tax=Pinctada imbricata TaxID=66713 RepID=A0AA88XGJ4_PINIB|nr:hypothetical protein FSP39_017750 [Pinctada imbricata]